MTDAGTRLRRLRVGVNLCWLVPGVVGGSEEAITRTLLGLAAMAPDALDVVLFAQPSLRDAHPALVDAFETIVAPVTPPNKVVRVGLEHTWLPWAVRRADIDLVHDAGGTAPGRMRVPRVLTVHDIQPLDLPDNFHPIKAAHLGRAVPKAVASASRVLVPSSFVRDRLVDRLAVPTERIAVVPWPAPEHRDPAPIDDVRRRLDITGRFVLLPAITYAHKEHVVAVRMIHRLAARHRDVTLVLTGGEGPHEAVVRAEIARLGLGERVVRTGRVPEPDLASLFEHAEVLVWPSIYEGFGNPVVEAMAAGTPVVVADAGASPEIVGDAAAVVAPGDDAQFAIEVHRLLDDTDLRERRIASGRSRAAWFSAARAAEGTVAAYRYATPPL